MNKEQKQIIKKINQAYIKLSVLNNIKWTAYRDDLFNLIRKDETQHRKSFGDRSYSKDTASVSDCARLFVVQNIAESLLNRVKYTIKDYLIIRKSCLYAQSLVENYREQIEKAWTSEDIKALADLDYISLINWELYQETTDNKKIA